jgi:preprotein translocase subunit SecG
MSFLLYLSTTLLVIICIFLILLVLIQKGRGGGLASAFGGGGGNTAFGSKTGDVLTWATSVVFGIFLILAVVTNLTADSLHKQRTTGVVQEETPVAPASENPLAPAAPTNSAPMAPAPTTQSLP